MGVERPRTGPRESCVLGRRPRRARCWASSRSSLTHEDALKVIPKVLSSYIEGRLSADPAELTEWTVLLVSNTQAPPSQEDAIAGLQLGLIERSQHPNGEARYERGDRTRYSIRRLISPKDEWADLSKTERAAAIEDAQRLWRENGGKSRQQQEPSEPTGIATRHARPPTRGLLMIYPLMTPSEFGSSLPTIAFALSFPTSPEATPVEYTVTNIYWQLEFGLT